MGRTLQSKWYGAVCVWCCLLFLFLCATGGVQAASSNSSGVTSDDHTDDGDDGRSKVERGMEPFYDMIKSFLGVLQPHRISDQPWLNLTQLIRGDFDEGELKDWKNWAEYLVGFLVCVVVGVLFFLVMPITGLIFCCLRCCGKCGGRPKPQDPKHARCKRNTYCTLLVVLNTVALAGVVCAFLSNQILYEKLQNQNSMGPTGKIVGSADSVNQYTNDTIREIEVKVLHRFVHTSEVILTSIGDSAVNAVEEVLNALDAPHLLSETKAIATGVLESIEDLVDVGVRLHYLSTRGQQLAENLTAIQTELDAVCTGSPPCPGYNADDYTVTANFSALDDLATEASNVNKSVNLAEDITKAEETITNAKNETTQSVETGIDDAKDSVADVEQSIEDAVQEVTDDLQGKISAEVDKFRADMLDLQDDISTYSKYVWYAGIGISSALLLIVVVYYIGILFGLCGERPGFGAQCCNTGAGANFLMAGVGMTFLLSWLIMLVCIILFAVGGPVYTELCRYFDEHNPRALQPFNDALMDAVDLNKVLFDGKDVDLDLVNILEECESDKAIYYVLRLDYMVNLTYYTDLSPVREALDTLKGETLSIPNITILTPDMNQSIANFATSGLDQIQFDDYYTEINKNMTQGNLQEEAQELRNFANTPGLPQQQKDTLLSVASRLDQLHLDYVVPMQRDRDSLRASITSLKARVESGIQDTVGALVNSLIRAQDKFNGQKDQLVEEEITKLIDVVMTQAESLVATILNDVHTNIGKCRPVFDSFYSISDAACIATLEPMNAVWFSIGWCLFFFVPCLIFAVKLAGLYRREHEERDFDDPQLVAWNFSQYMDGKQDSIPLTSRQQSGHGEGVGVANRGYQDDSYMGPTDYPHYKGQAAPTNHRDDDYMRPAPPPYGSHPGGHGAMNGEHRGKDHRMYPY